MIFVNGVVYTVNDKQPMAEAIAIEKGKIVGVGSNEEIKSSFKSKNIVDLAGKPVYPGFIDSHAHMENLGAMLTNVNLVGTNSIEEIQSLVVQRTANIPPGGWVRGRGWDQNKWARKSFPTREMLDAVAKDVPIYLTRVDGHAVWVNSKVLEIAGVVKSTPDPPGGRILRDATGEPTGVFVDNAIDSLDTRLPVASEHERTEAVEKAVRACISVGLTEVHDMGVDSEIIGIYKKLINAGRFPFRVYAAIGGVGETWDRYLLTGPEIDGNDGRLTVRALKLYADGALGSRGAALVEPYTDDPSNRGLTLTSSEIMQTVASKCLEKGFQLCIHAIGDRANHIVLSVYKEAYKLNQIKAKDARFRVEHAQVIDPNDISMFNQLGVIPAMQPTHCTSDMYWAEERLGSKRLAGAYAWRSLLEQGSIIPGGSDFPVESPNPLWGFYAAITRQDHSGWPLNGWHPEQKMNREEALKSFTIWGAYAGFEEQTKGTLEPGKVADMVVLSDDIMKVDPKKILETKVELTMVAGDVAYSSGNINMNK